MNECFALANIKHSLSLMEPCISNGILTPGRSAFITFFLSNPVLATEKKKEENILAICSIPSTPLLVLARQRQGQKLKVCHFSCLWRVWDQGQSPMAEPGESPAVLGELQWERPVPALESPRHCCSRDLLGEPGLPSALGENHHTRRDTEEPKKPPGAEAAEGRLLNIPEHRGLDDSGQHGTDNLCSQGVSFVLVVSIVAVVCFGVWVWCLFVCLFVLMEGWEERFGGEHALEDKTHSLFFILLFFCYWYCCGYCDFQQIVVPIHNLS